MEITVQFWLEYDRDAGTCTWRWEGPSKGIAAVALEMVEAFEEQCPYLWKRLDNSTPDMVYYEVTQNK